MVNQEEIFEAANSMKLLYDQYVTVGFTKKEALELCKTVMLGNPR